MKQKDISHVSERNYIFSLKTIAIISVVSAHSASVVANANQLNALFSWILGQIGSIGVGIFFIVSGYLFHKNNNSFSVFFSKKINTILIPCITTGTGVYLYAVLRKGGLNVSNWLNFLLGNGSYLYYLTLLIVFYVIFFFASGNKVLIRSTIALSCISILLTAMGFLDAINPYLNPLNFIAYFSIGLLMANEDGLIKVARKCATYNYLLLSLYVTLLVFVKLFGITSGYWGYATLILQPIAIAVAFGFATEKFIYNEKVLELGKESFSIYLLHMPVAGIITFIFNRYDLWQLTLARPLIVIGITFSFMYLYKNIGSKFKIETFSNRLIGTK